MRGNGVSCIKGTPVLLGLLGPRVPLVLCRSRARFPPRLGAREGRWSVGSSALRGASRPIQGTRRQATTYPFGTKHRRWIMAQHARHDDAASFRAHEQAT